MLCLMCLMYLRINQLSSSKQFIFTEAFVWVTELVQSLWSIAFTWQWSRIIILVYQYNGGCLDKGRSIIKLEGAEESYYRACNRIFNTENQSFLLGKAGNELHFSDFSHSFWWMQVCVWCVHVACMCLSTHSYTNAYAASAGWRFRSLSCACSFLDL